MTEQVPEVRVGDRERRAVDARLQEALADGVLTLTEYDERAAECWAARTRSDLDALTRDLPGAALEPPPARTSPATGPRRVVAVMSESELGVPVLPGQAVSATAVMGTSKVDLRREDLPREVHVRATAFMGEVKVHVPPGTTVHMTGAAVMGERKVRVGPPLASGSVVHVSATAVMGTVTVDDKERKGGLLHRAAHPPTSSHLSHGGRSRVLRGVVTAALVAGGVLVAGQVVGADDGTTVFGSREVRVTDQTRVQVGTVFGSTEVVVPDDARVRTTGTFVFGGIECGDACTATDGREVVVEADGAFGSVQVVTESERAEDEAEDEAEDAREDVEEP